MLTPAMLEPGAPSWLIYSKASSFYICDVQHNRHGSAEAYLQC